MFKASNSKTIEDFIDFIITNAINSIKPKIL